MASDAGNRPAPTVVVEKAATVSESSHRRYVGSVEAVNSVNIMPRVSGTLIKTHFTEGAMVKAGDFLYEIEDTTYRAAVDILKAQIEAQEATIKFAESEYQRKNKLLQSNVVAIAAQEQALMEIKVAKANKKRLEASLRDAENTLSYTRITAPVSGIIGKSRFSEGNLITPQSGMLVDIQQISPIYVKFSISERALRRDFGGLANIKKQAAVQVKLADGTVAGEIARVTLVNNKINTKSNTITMWATFPNRKHDLLPGSFVTVLLSSEAQNAEGKVTVMPSALLMENDGCSVYVLDQNNVAEKRKVKLGATINGRQVILEGVRPGEVVVVDGTHKIQPGMPVVPVDAEQVFAGK